MTFRPLNFLFSFNDFSSKITKSNDQNVRKNKLNKITILRYYVKKKNNKNNNK